MNITRFMDEIQWQNDFQFVIDNMTKKGEPKKKILEFVKKAVANKEKIIEGYAMETRANPYFKGFKCKAFFDTNKQRMGEWQI
jgi:hypothetical protein